MHCDSHLQETGERERDEQERVRARGLERGREREREREREKGRKDILIEEALKIIIFIRFELQWTVIDRSPLSLNC